MTVAVQREGEAPPEPPQDRFAISLTLPPACRLGVGELPIGYAYFAEPIEIL